MALPFDTSVVCPVLIGREAALASFERVCAQVTSGEGRTVLVSGEAGIGKSRLVAEARARLGPEQDRTLPLAPLVDLVRSLLGDSREAFLPHLAPFAPELLKLMPDLALFLPEVRPTPRLSPEQEQPLLCHPHPLLAGAGLPTSPGARHRRPAVERRHQPRVFARTRPPSALVPAPAAHLSPGGGPPEALAPNAQAQEPERISTKAGKEGAHDTQAWAPGQALHPRTPRALGSSACSQATSCENAGPVGEEIT